MSINREIESLNCLALINENSTLEEINEYIKKALIINPLCLEAYVLKSRVVASFIARGEILKEAISLINDKHDTKTIALVKEEYGKYLLENGSYQLAYEQFKDIITLFPLDNKGFRYLNRAILIHLEKDLKEVDLVIYGHSHKFSNEKIDNIVYLNPGACGRKRFSLPLSMAIVEINLDDIKIEKIDLN